MIFLIVSKSKIANIQPSVIIIKANRIIRFIKVGAFLHVTAVVGVLICVIGIQKSMDFFSLNDDFNAYLWVIISGIAFTIPIFAEFDANGRYQNYKQIKDRLYKMGYDHRLIKPFMHSKCQRDAVIVAAADLDYKKKVKDLFYKNGYRWYHIFPDLFIKKPLILFKKDFWRKILFTKTYQLQNFYW